MKVRSNRIHLVSSFGTATAGPFEALPAAWLRQTTATATEALDLHTQQRLLDQLDEVYGLAKYPNWDREGAAEVALSTYLQATHFIAILPTGLQAPSVEADVDGFIEFEWYNDGRSFSVLVSSSPVVLYAAYYSAHDRGSGRIAVHDKLPKHIVNFIERVYASDY